MFETLKSFFRKSAPKIEIDDRLYEIADGETEAQGKARGELLQSQMRTNKINAEIAELKMQSFKEKIIPQAKAFALESIMSGLAFSAEKSELEDAYVQAAIDDNISPLEGGKDRLTRLKTMIGRRKPHGFNREMLVPEISRGNDLKIVES